MAEQNQIAAQPQTTGGLAKLKTILNAPSVQEQFQNALAENKDLFVASIIDLYNGDKSLQTCQPAQIVSEALKAAVLDLPINRALGFAYIVVYNNKKKVRNEQTGRDEWIKVPTPTFIPGYKGYIQLAMRTGQYRTINADFVYEGEMRKVSKLTGEIALDGEKKSDKIIGYFCYFELLNGFNKTLFVSVEEMAQYALRYSPSFKGNKKPSAEALIKLAQANQPLSKVGWEGNFNDMALKTVIRRLLSKYGYLSVEMQNALSKDVEDSQMSRNDLISENANGQAIELENARYEEVDTETGEIKKSEEAAPAENAEEAPSY